MIEVAEKHKHKFTKLAKQRVRLYDKSGSMRPEVDIFIYKMCECGFKEVLKMIRKDRNSEVTLQNSD